MNIAVLKVAAGWVSELERAESHADAVKDFKVYGVQIARGVSDDPVNLGRGSRGGTGSVTSIGWSDDLEAELTTAFQNVFRARVETAKAKLVELGVTDSEAA